MAARPRLARGVRAHGLAHRLGPPCLARSWRVSLPETVKGLRTDDVPDRGAGVAWLSSNDHAHHYRMAPLGATLDADSPSSSRRWALAAGVSACSGRRRRRHRDRPGRHLRLREQHAVPLLGATPRPAQRRRAEPGGWRSGHGADHRSLSAPRASPQAYDGAPPRQAGGDGVADGLPAGHGPGPSTDFVGQFDADFAPSLSARRSAPKTTVGLDGDG